VVDALKPIREKHRVPAMIAVVLTSKGIESCGVVGVRKNGSEIPATIHDKWHLGSCTKAMTATLFGNLVEQGALRWNTTVAQVFPNLAPQFHSEARAITVIQLLSHHAGLPRDFPWAEVSKKGTVHEQRLLVLRQALSAKPRHTPGSQYEYSNLGYVVAGAILEKETGMPWERAISDKLFKPLKMTSAGFGGVGTPGLIDQPWGHDSSGTPTAKNGPSVDLPPVKGPAGTVHCTIQDWARFVADQLRGERGEPALLETFTYRAMHTPPFDGDYGLGWIVVQRPWGGGTVLNHVGTNKMNKSNVWIAPKRDFAILVCANQGDAAAKATDEAVIALIKLHESKLHESK
jgi:CubicO group peptidase (beta-lactamase class C family)